MKRKWRLGLAGAMIIGALASMSFGAYAAQGDVEIDQNTFPDVNFRKYVSENFDTDKNGVLSKDEIANAKTINMEKQYNEKDNLVEDLTGVEVFTSLETLNIVRNNLSELDLSSNTELRVLNCKYNNLSALDLSSNTELLELDCSSNKLQTLDISTNTKLISLNCSYNELQSIDVGLQTDLEILDVGSTRIQKLDVTENLDLKVLECGRTGIKELDLSKNTELEELRMYGAALTKLDVSNNAKLTYLAVPNNQLTELDVSNNPLLETLGCYGNNLSVLDVSDHPYLKYLTCDGDQIDELYIDNCNELIRMTCRGNRFKCLVIDKAEKLLRTYQEGKCIPSPNGTNVLYYTNSDYQKEWGYSSTYEIQDTVHFGHTLVIDPAVEPTYKSTGLTEGSHCSYCGKIIVAQTEIPKLQGAAIDETTFPDVNFRNYVSENFDTDKNGILSKEEIANAKTINMEKAYNEKDNLVEDLTGVEIFTSLETLNIGRNNLSELDLSSNTGLRVLNCKYNNLSALDMSKNTELLELDCGSNKLKTLDISTNTKLISLDCSYNELRSIDVRLQTDLEILDVGSNRIQELDVTENLNLKELECDRTGIKELDVSNNTELEKLGMYGDWLTELDVSNNAKLTYLAVPNNKLTELDVSNNPLLEILGCYGNKLTVLDLSNNPNLKSLCCEGDQIDELIIDNCNELIYVECEYNRFKCLILDNAEKLLRTCTEGRRVKSQNGTNLVWYTNDNYRDECGYSSSIQINDDVQFSHTVVIDPAVESTYTSTGLTEGSHCSHCGKVIVEQQVVPVKEVTNGWYSEDGKYYYFCDGSAVKNTVMLIKGEYYGFDQDGAMYDNTVFDLGEEHYRAKAGGVLYLNSWYKNADETWYYFGEDGKAIRNRVIKAGPNYYGFNEYGKMYENCTFHITDASGITDTYSADESGALYVRKWIRNTDGKWMYLGEDGKAVRSSVVKIGQVYYGFDADCVMYENTAFRLVDASDGTAYSYCAKDDGTLYTNRWKQDANGDWFYYGADAKAYQNQVALLGGQYYGFGSTGVMYSNKVFRISTGARYRAKTGGALYVNAWYNNTYGGFGWEKAWYYFGEDGKAVTGINTIGGTDYLFLDDCTLMVNDITEYNGKTYKANGSGALIELTDGWKNVNGSYYYVKNGKLVKNRVIRVDSAYYGFDGEGRMFDNGTFKAHYVEEENDVWYYVHARSGGSLYVNKWYQDPDGEWYYYGEEGRSAKDIMNVGGVDYLFDEEGHMLTFSAIYYDGKNYVSNGGGVASVIGSGWTKKGNYWFYVANGQVVKNTAVQDGKTWYAFDEKGRMLDDKAAKIDNDYYRAKVNGSLYVNAWFTDTNGDKYYYGEGGKAVTGNVILNGTQYTFDETGRLVN